MEDPQYQPDTVARQSRAAMSLCLWTHAMSVYNRVAKLVEPKRQALAKAESELAEANATLSAKQARRRAQPHTGTHTRARARTHTGTHSRESLSITHAQWQSLTPSCPTHTRARRRS